LGGAVEPDQTLTQKGGPFVRASFLFQASGRFQKKAELDNLLL
jgi:hypothetical protein